MTREKYFRSKGLTLNEKVETDQGENEGDAKEKYFEEVELEEYAFYNFPLTFKFEALLQIKLKGTSLSLCE